MGEGEVGLVVRSWELVSLFATCSLGHWCRHGGCLHASFLKCHSIDSHLPGPVKEMEMSFCSCII